MEKTVVDDIYTFDYKTKKELQPLIGAIIKHKIETLRHTTIKSPEPGGRRDLGKAFISIEKLQALPVPQKDRQLLQNQSSNLTLSSPMFTGTFTIRKNLEYGALTGKSVRILAMEPALNSGHRKLDDVGLIGTPDSDVYHGAHVISLLKQNAPDAKISVTGFPVQLSDSEKERLKQELLSTDIINLSIASDSNTGSFPELEYLFSALHGRNENCLLALAASNDSYNCDEPFNPNEKYLRDLSKNPEWKKLLLIGSLDQDACPAFYSNRPGAYKPFQANFVYTYGTKVFSMGSNSGYEHNSGTSMATPGVSGCIALLIEYLRTTLKSPHKVTPEFLKECILQSADRDFYINKENFVEGFDVCIHVTEHPSSAQGIQFYRLDDGKVLALVEEAYDPKIFGMGILNIESALIYAKAKLENKTSEEINALINAKKTAIGKKYISDTMASSQKTAATNVIGQHLAKFAVEDVRGQRFIALSHRVHSPITADSAASLDTASAAAAASASVADQSIQDYFWKAVMKKSLQIAPSQNNKNLRSTSIMSGQFESTPFAWIAHNSFKSLAKDFFTWLTHKEPSFLETCVNTNFEGEIAKSVGKQSYIIAALNIKIQSMKQGILRDILLMLFPLTEQESYVFQWIQETWNNLQPQERAAVYLISNPHNALDLECYLIQQILFSNNSKLVEFFMQDLKKNSSDKMYRRIIGKVFDVGKDRISLFHIAERCLSPDLQEMVTGLTSVSAVKHDIGNVAAISGLGG